MNNHIHPLQAYREANGLTRVAAAELIGVTPGMVGHIEKGIRKISPERAMQAGVPKEVLRPDLWPTESNPA